MTNNTCPKCSSNMVPHPSLLSMPLSSSQEITANDTKKVNIEDQDANFVFRFSSCSKCGYSEFYLTNGSGTRI
jgi:predicted nucleic-acid-binding Zn-ribbon protein